METSRVAPQTTSSEREARPVGCPRLSQFWLELLLQTRVENEQHWPVSWPSCPAAPPTAFADSPDAPTVSSTVLHQALEDLGFRSSVDSARSRISYRFSSRTFSCASASRPASISTSPAAWHAARKCASRCSTSTPLAVRAVQAGGATRA